MPRAIEVVPEIQSPGDRSLSFDAVYKGRGLSNMGQIMTHVLTQIAKRIGVAMTISENSL